jgi:hypothetical protein
MNCSNPCANAARYHSNAALVREALEQGTQRGRPIAQEKMEMVRDALEVNYFAKHANAAKAGCPVSQAPAGIEITLAAKLAAA